MTKAPIQHRLLLQQKKKMKQISSVLKLQAFGLRLRTLIWNNSKWLFNDSCTESAYKANDYWQVKRILRRLPLNIWLRFDSKLSRVCLCDISNWIKRYSIETEMHRQNKIDKTTTTKQEKQMTRKNIHCRMLALWNSHANEHTFNYRIRSQLKWNIKHQQFSVGLAFLKLVVSCFYLGEFGSKIKFKYSRTV